MGKFTNIRYAGKRKPYLLPDSLKVLYSYRIDFFFLSLLLILSIFYFRGILENDVLMAHGDLKYALTVDGHLFHHLNKLPIHAAKIPLLSILYPLQIILGDLLAVKVFTILILFLSATLVYFANKQFVSTTELIRQITEQSELNMCRHYNMSYAIKKKKPYRIQDIMINNTHTERERGERSSFN
jgi:hypothetical protein